MHGRGRDKGKNNSSSHTRKSEAEKENNRGNALFQMKEYQKAVECYNKAFELDDTNVQYLLNAAAALFEVEEYMNCIKICQKAIMLGYKLSADRQLLKKAFIRVGRARLKQGRVQDARKYFDSLIDCGLSSHERMALDEFRHQVNQMEAALNQGLQKTRYQMLRPRARLFTPMGAPGVHAFSAPYPALHPSLLPCANDRIQTLTLGVPSHGFLKQSMEALADHMTSSPKFRPSALTMHVTYNTTDAIAHEILLNCLSLQRGLYCVEGDTSPQLKCAAARLTVLVVLIEYSLAMPPFFRKLLNSALEWLLRVSGSLKTWAAARIESPGAKSAVALPFVFDTEAGLAAVRDVWRGWLEAPKPDLMALMQELTEASHGPMSLTNLQAAAEDENLLSDLIYQFRSTMAIDVCPPAATAASALHPDAEERQAEVLHWYRYFSFAIPESVASQLSLGETGIAVDAAGSKAGGPVLHSLLLDKAPRSPERITQWSFNPVFLCRTSPLMNVPVPQVHHTFRVPAFTSNANTILEARMKDVDHWGKSVRRLMTGSTKVQVYLYQSRSAGLEMVCDLATNHASPHVAAPPLEHTPASEAPPRSGIYFDLIDATAATEVNALVALLQMLQPMLKDATSSCLLTHHSALEDVPAAEQVKSLETLVGASSRILKKIFGLRLAEPSDILPRGTACWRNEGAQTQPESLHDSEEFREDFRQLFWRVLQHVLLPQQYREKDRMARDFPATETTGILIGLFDLVHRRRKLPGSGFVESLLNDTFFQGVTTSSHIKLAIQVVCRQYLSTLHENVVSAPAQCLPLCPIVQYQVTFNLLNDLGKGIYRADCVPLAVALVYKEAQEGSWYRLREEEMAQWLITNKGAIHVIDALELVALDTRLLTVSFYLPQSETAKRADKQLVLIHWEKSIFLSEPLPLEKLMSGERKSKARKKKKGKKKKDDANEEAGDLDSADDD